MTSPDASREYPKRPIACAAAVVFRPSHPADGPDDGVESVLLVRRGTEPHLGLWSFPGGAIEPGETARDCAVRETREETGVAIRILDLADVVDSTKRDGDGNIHYQFLIVDYLACPIDGELRAGSDASDARWVRVDRLDEVEMVPPTGDVLWKALKLWREKHGSI